MKALSPVPVVGRGASLAADSPIAYMRRRVQKPRATLVIVVIGFSLDVQNNTFFGFHTIALMIFHLIGTEWVQIGQQGELIRPFLLQIMANLVIAMTWFILTYFLKEASTAWSPYRFCSDSVISILIFIPLCRWFPFFCEELLQLLGALGEQEQRPI